MDEFAIDDHEKIWKCLDIVNVRIRIEDKLREWGISLRRCSGRFIWKARCPLPGHNGKGEGGRERTPSFYVSRDNRFYCFGCCGYGSVVDLISLVHGVPRIEVVRQFAMNLGLVDKDGNWDEELLASMPDTKRETFDIEKTIDPHILRASAALRHYMRSFLGSSEFEKEFAWAEKVGGKIDELLHNIGHEDWEYAKDIYNQVISIINKRKRRNG